MADDILKQAEGILEKAAWGEFWREYEGAVSIGAWGQAHDLLEKTLIPHLLENHNKMVECLNQKDELISKLKELAEISGKTINRYEGIINEYESRGGQR